MRQDNRSKTLPSSRGRRSNPGGELRRPAASKNRKPRQQRLLAFGEEVVAPVEQRAQGLVAWKGRAASPDEQEEAVVQAAREPLRRHHPQLRNGKLDRHRDAVETLADVRDRRGVRVAQGEAVDGRGGALDEQADRAVAEGFRGGDALRAAAGTSGSGPDRCSPRRCPEARGSSRGAGARGTRARAPPRAAPPLPRGALAQFSRMRSAFFWRRYPAALSVAERAALHGHPDRAADRLWRRRSGSSSGASSAIQTPSGYSSRKRGPDLDREARHAGAAGADQRHDAVLREPRPDLRHVPLARHERGHGPRAGCGPWRRASAASGSAPSGPARRADRPAPPRPDP